MSRKLVCLLLVIALTIPSFSASSIAVQSVSVNSGVVTVALNGTAPGGSVFVALMRDSSIVYCVTVPALGNTVQAALPQRFLSAGTYIVTASYISESGVKGTTVMTTYQIAAQASATQSILTGVPRVNSPDLSRCVLVPYAKVYTDATMTTVAVELKRYDLVSVYSYNSGIAHIKYRIQSGNGTLTVQNNINALYQSDDDLVGTGYMYISDLEIPNRLTLSSSDRQRYAVELAYTRLGLKGPYSQSRRFIDYYLDCAALVSWCWYNAGIDWTYYGTAVSGIEAWAASTPNTLIWSSVENSQAAQSAYNAQTHETPYDRNMGNITPTYDNGNYVIPASSPYYGKTITQDTVTLLIMSVAKHTRNEPYTVQQAYAEVLLNRLFYTGAETVPELTLEVVGSVSQVQEQAVYAAINGVDIITNKDVVVFSANSVDNLYCRVGNYYCGYANAAEASLHQSGLIENQDGTTASLNPSYITSYLMECNDEVFASLQPGDILIWNYPTTVTAPDGSQVTVQVNETGSYGGDHTAIFVGYDPATRNVTIIESSIASVEPGSNTKVTVIGPYSSKRSNIIKIIRPTGGAVITAGDYNSSIDYDYIGSISSFLASPVRNSVNVTIPFGSVVAGDPHFSGPHNGMDFQGAIDNKVYASEAGVVTNIGIQNGMYFLEIAHENGIVTRYYNLSSVVVSLGETVNRDRWIGRMGVSPSNPEKGLLHYEVWVNGVAVDPASYLS